MVAEDTMETWHDISHGPAHENETRLTVSLSSSSIFIFAVLDPACPSPADTILVM